MYQNRTMHIIAYLSRMLSPSGFGAVAVASGASISFIRAAADAPPCFACWAHVYLSGIPCCACVWFAGPVVVPPALKPPLDSAVCWAPGFARATGLPPPQLPLSPRSNC